MQKYKNKFAYEALAYRGTHIFKTYLKKRFSIILSFGKFGDYIEQIGIIVEMLALSVRAFSTILLFGLRQTPLNENVTKVPRFFMCVLKPKLKRNNGATEKPLSE